MRIASDAGVGKTNVIGLVEDVVRIDWFIAVRGRESKCKILIIFILMYEKLIMLRCTLYVSILLCYHIMCYNFIHRNGFDWERTNNSRHTFGVSELGSSIHWQGTCSCTESNTFWPISTTITRFTIQLSFVLCAAGWIKVFVTHAYT